MTSDNNRILALFPHPDDMEFLCAGTLVRLRALGFETHVATMTAGDKGSAVHSRAEIAGIRRAEAAEGADAVGASRYHCLEFQDLEIVFDNLARQRVAALLRTIDPFMVFTTPPADYMFDHEITSQLVRDACFNAAVPNYETSGAAGQSSGIPYLYYTQSLDGRDIFGNPSRATCVVDVSSQIAQKAAALASHASQRLWLQKQHGMDEYIDSMKRASARCGKRIGVEYAESFCQHLGHPHPQDDKLAELLGAIRVS